MFPQDLFSVFNQKKNTIDEEKKVPKHVHLLEREKDSDVPPQKKVHKEELNQINDNK